jgi:hypothetical protein
VRRSAKNPAIVDVSWANALNALDSDPIESPGWNGDLTINPEASQAADGIRVNTVASATTETSGLMGQEAGADRSRHLDPLGRVGRPEDVAARDVFLVPATQLMTGHAPVDAGVMTDTQTC